MSTIIGVDDVVQDSGTTLSLSAVTGCTVTALTSSASLKTAQLSDVYRIQVVRSSTVRARFAIDISIPTALAHGCCLGALGVKVDNDVPVAIRHANGPIPGLSIPLVEQHLLITSDQTIDLLTDYGPALLFEFPVATVGMPLTLIVDIGRIWASKIARVAKPIGDGIGWKPEDSGQVAESRGFQAYPDFGSVRGVYTRPLNRISGANELSYRADPDQSLRYVLNRAGSTRPIVFGRETISGSFGYCTSSAITPNELIYGRQAQTEEVKRQAGDLFQTTLRILQAK